jgi:hypothetical protein
MSGKMMRTTQRRSLTGEERATAIRTLSEVYDGRLAVGQEDHLVWQAYRQRIVLASLDMQTEDNHCVGLWAWPSYPLEFQQKAYEAASRLTAAGIPRKIYRGDSMGIIKVED